MSFGIPVRDIPFLEYWEVKEANHLKWIEKRKQKEKYLKTHPLPKTAVDLPLRSDVILGRGTPFNCHPGNKRLREIVENLYDEYDNETRAGKTKLAEKIVSMVHEYGGMFRKPDNECGMWIEVSYIDAKNKVTHCFRRKREVTIKGVKTVRVDVEKGCSARKKRLLVLQDDGK